MSKVCAVLYPDPKMRTLLGWPIRWLAGVFAFVWLAAGALPVESASETRPQSACGLSSAGSEAAISMVDHASAVFGLLGSNSGAESENEIEEQERSHSAASVLAWSLIDRRDSFHSIEAANPSAIRLASISRSANRAPPLA